MLFSGFLSLSLPATGCALFYGAVLTHQPPSRLRTIVKTSSTALLALISVLAGGPVWLTLALLLGAAGDGFLSLDHNKGFLPGLGCFLLGHAAFVALLWPAGGGVEILQASPARMIGALLLFLLGGMVLRQLWPKLGDLRLPVAAYVLVIVAMGVAALALPLDWPLGLGMLAAGLFIFSDFLLAQLLFVMAEANRFKTLVSTLLWFAYWPAQALFAAAFLL